MNECKGECTTCQEDCKMRCPVCHANAVAVPIETVKAILKDTSELIEEDIYMCLNRKCEATYFNTKQYYVKDELKVPVWFKQNPEDMIVCYCYNISFHDIKEAITNGCKTKEDIIKYYHKENISKNCSLHNPIGKCCDQLFNNVITYIKGVN